VRWSLKKAEEASITGSLDRSEPQAARRAAMKGADADDEEDQADDAEEELAVGCHSWLGEDFAQAHAEATQHAQQTDHGGGVHGVLAGAFAAPDQAAEGEQPAEARRDEGGEAPALGEEVGDDGPDDEQESGKNGGANGGSHEVSGLR